MESLQYLGARVDNLAGVISDLVRRVGILEDMDIDFSLGEYDLIMKPNWYNTKLFRFTRGLLLPLGYYRVDGVYDEDGMLKPEFWSFPVYRG